jgi:hypothetical protein
VNLYGFSSLLEDLRQYWTAEAGCFATPGSAFMAVQVRFNGVMLCERLGGDDERLDADVMLASEESQAEEAVAEESVDEAIDEAVDEAERFRWQL